MKRLSKEEIDDVRDATALQDLFLAAEVKDLLVTIDALTSERDDALKSCEQAGELIAELHRDLALSREREKYALRRGYNAGTALDEEGMPVYPWWGDFEKHLADEAEHTARLGRIAEAEEKEFQLPQDTYMRDKFDLAMEEKNRVADAVKKQDEK